MTNRSDTIAAQNRAEELLLLLIEERVDHAIGRMFDYDDERPLDDSERSFRRGFAEGVDAVREVLGEIIVLHNEGNLFRAGL